ncbi:MAG: hypothetical protein HOH08_08445 [Gammaproteobacteria bacterium]|nr:hypothetical protein [Gammaproteobacteria bacterium]
MKHIIIILFFVLVNNTAFAEDSLMSKKECEETKSGIRDVLGIADYLFKENEKNNSLKQSEEKRKLKEEDLLGGAIAFSQIAANYSIVYDVWCKD